MSTASDRWLIVSLPIMLVALLYFGAGAFTRHTTGDLAWGSLTLWNIVVTILLCLWSWPRRRVLEAAMKKAPLRARMLVLSAILASAVASTSLMIVGISLLEENSLGLQILGGLPLAVAALVLPGWALWFLRWTGRWLDPAIL